VAQRRPSPPTATETVSVTSTPCGPIDRSANKSEILDHCPHLNSLSPPEVALDALSGLTSAPLWNIGEFKSSILCQPPDGISTSGVANSRGQAKISTVADRSIVRDWRRGDAHCSVAVGGDGLRAHDPHTASIRQCLSAKRIGCRWWRCCTSSCGGGPRPRYLFAYAVAGAGGSTRVGCCASMPLSAGLWQSGNRTVSVALTGGTGVRTARCSRYGSESPRPGRPRQGTDHGPTPWIAVTSDARSGPTSPLEQQHEARPHRPHAPAIGDPSSASQSPMRAVHAAVLGRPGHTSATSDERLQASVASSNCRARPSSSSARSFTIATRRCSRLGSGDTACLARLRMPKRLPRTEHQPQIGRKPPYLRRAVLIVAPRVRALWLA